MGEMVHKVSVRIADVTYTLVSSEPEASIQRAVVAAERLVEAARAANPALSLSASTVLALVNATGDRERLVDELAASEERLREAEAKITGLRREIGGLKEQNSILVREIRRNHPSDTTKPNTARRIPAAELAVPTEEPPPPDETPDVPLEEDKAPAGATERHTDGNITFVLDPRIMEAEPDSAESPDLPDNAAPVASPEASSEVSQNTEPVQTPGKPFPGRFVQTGFDDLLPHG